MTSDIEETRRAYRLLDDGHYRDALEIADKISDPSLRAALLIDTGSRLGKSGSIRKGVELLHSILQDSDELTQAGTLSSFYYNIANGHYAIYMLRRKRRSSVTPPNDHDLRSAKVFYRNALKSDQGENPTFLAQVNINYANCLSQMGRGIEAIEYYKRALSHDPTNGMASGNMGVELYHIARITGAYYHDYLQLAQKYLNEALEPPMHLKHGSQEAVKGFQGALNDIEEIINAHEHFSNHLSNPHTPKMSDNFLSYLRFCKSQDLLLNAWVGDKFLAPANTDQIYYGPIITELQDEETVPELLRILNEVKESYACARFLYYQATTGSSFISECSRMTLYFSAQKVEINGLSVSLCKSAYVRAFDTLDKVARIINVYFGIGNRDDHFWHVFAERQSQGQEKTIRFVARPTIVSQNNISLFALADLCIDYFESEHVDLKTIDHRRNLITHDYLAVLPEFSFKSLSSNEIEKEDLFKQTLSVLKLTKLAIMYAVSSINIAESRKSNARTIPWEYRHHHGDDSLEAAN